MHEYCVQKIEKVENLLEDENFYGLSYWKSVINHMSVFPPFYQRI